MPAKHGEQDEEHVTSEQLLPPIKTSQSISPV